MTGASRGIGTAIAERFAADGAAVAVTARTVDDGDHPLPGSINATVHAITDAGGTAIAVAADLARTDDRRRLVATVEKELGPIDVLVNNAAVTYFEPVDGFDESHYRTSSKVQVCAPFELARLVLPGMRAPKRGWILNISSGAARHPQGPPYERRMGRGTVYGMCKAALERFTTGLAAEVYADNIAVNVLSPSGLVATPGVVHHGLDRNVPAEFLSRSYMAEGGLPCCAPATRPLTGRVTYAKPILDELGVSVRT